MLEFCNNKLTGNSQYRKLPRSTYETALNCLRVERELTQKEIASALGITDGAVSLWMKGAQSVPERRKEQLAKMLGITVPKLKRLEGDAAQEYIKSRHSKGYAINTTAILKGKEEGTDVATSTQEKENPGTHNGNISSTFIRKKLAKTIWGNAGKQVEAKISLNLEQVAKAYQSVSLPVGVARLQAELTWLVTGKKIVMLTWGKHGGDYHIKTTANLKAYIESEEEEIEAEETEQQSETEQGVIRLPEGNAEARANFESEWEKATSVITDDKQPLKGIQDHERLYEKALENGALGRSPAVVIPLSPEELALAIAGICMDYADGQKHKKKAEESATLLDEANDYAANLLGENADLKQKLAEFRGGSNLNPDQRKGLKAILHLLDALADEARNNAGIAGLLAGITKLSAEETQALANGLRDTIKSTGQLSD